MGYRRSKKQSVDFNAFAISASNCAAVQEVMADERINKAKVEHDDFINLTRHKVRL